MVIRRELARIAGRCLIKPAANRGLSALPVRAFPAVAAAALTRPDAPEFVKRLRLVAASLAGCL